RRIQHLIGCLCCCRAESLFKSRRAEPSRTQHRRATRKQDGNTLEKRNESLTTRRFFRPGKGAAFPRLEADWRSRRIFPGNRSWIRPKGSRSGAGERTRSLSRIARQEQSGSN